MTSDPVMLGTVPVGGGHPTVFVAEVGTFFNQDVRLAHEYIEAVASAGVPVFKTEILHDSDICLAGTGLEHHYRHANGEAIEDYRALIERKVVPLAEYARLFRACHERGLPVMASVYDVAGVDFVVEQGGCAVKIARNNIDNVPLIRAAARSGLPVVFDMGHVRLEEIAFAVRTAREAGAGDLIVNLHPGANPAPAEVHHLRTAETIRSMFGTPVGLSDHYRGEDILYAAAGAGIDLIEKGVDADPDRVEQDLVSALPMRDLPSVMQRLVACCQARGGTAPHVPAERDLSARAGLVAGRDLAAGQRLAPEAMTWAFPPVGIAAADFDRVAGRSLRRGLRTGEPITWGAVDFDD